MYVHPFIAAVPVTGDPEPYYEFIMQYWFFYPYNDAGNKHEGDWEHINVVISPRSQVTKPQTAQQVRALLARRPEDLEGDDPVVIRRIDYYFHENVMPLDYSRPNAYASKEEWRREFNSLPKEKLGMKEIAAEVRFRAWADPGETRVNTHPIGYIGADSKGLELFLYSPGARNQNGHGTYPFQGLFENIGPAASAEETKKSFDHQAYLSGKAPLPSFVEAYDKPERVKLLPDWERIYEKVFQDPEYRREWAWMVLPIRSGFPAAVSPFAGIVRHAETGNLAPFMVTYNGGWNRNGARGGLSSLRSPPTDGSRDGLTAGPGAEQPGVPERADRGADHAAADRPALQGRPDPGAPDLRKVPAPVLSQGRAAGPGYFDRGRGHAARE